MEETFGTLAGGGEVIVGRKAGGARFRQNIWRWDLFSRRREREAAAQTSPVLPNVRLMCLSFVSVLFKVRYLGVVIEGASRAAAAQLRKEPVSRGRLQRF